mmetsp:Transcript_24010/g.33049  ORF Transcript_24010/g.33049 Transcript_24010/m.33049 type:complete len:480 (+) Transcript_24010:169-1608(+)
MFPEFNCVQDPQRRRWGTADQIEKDAGNMPIEVGYACEEKKGNSGWDRSGWFSGPIESTNSPEPVGLVESCRYGQVESLNLTNSARVPGGATAQNRFCGPGSKYVPKFVQPAKDENNHNPDSDYVLQRINKASTSSPELTSHTWRSQTGGRYCNEGVAKSEQCASKEWTFDFEHKGWKRGQEQYIHAAASATDLNSSMFNQVTISKTPNNMIQQALDLDIKNVDCELVRERRHERFSLKHEELCAAFMKCTPRGASKREREIIPPAISCKASHFPPSPPSTPTSSEPERARNNWSHLVGDWTSYRCEDQSVVIINEVDITPERVATWASGAVPWPRMCRNYPGGELKEEELNKCREDIKDWLEKQKDKEASNLPELEMKTEDANEGNSSAQDALNAIANALRSDGVLPTGDVPKPQMTTGDAEVPSNNSFLEESHKDLIWKERSRRQESEKMLLSEMERCKELEKLLQGAGIEVPDRKA